MTSARHARFSPRMRQHSAPNNSAALSAVHSPPGTPAEKNGCCVVMRSISSKYNMSAAKSAAPTRAEYTPRARFDIQRPPQLRKFVI